MATARVGLRQRSITPRIISKHCCARRRSSSALLATILLPVRPLLDDKRSRLCSVQTRRSVRNLWRALEFEKRSPRNIALRIAHTMRVPETPPALAPFQHHTLGRGFRFGERQIFVGNLTDGPHVGTWARTGGGRVLAAITLAARKRSSCILASAIEFER